MSVMIKKVSVVTSELREDCYRIMNEQVGFAGDFYMNVKTMVEIGHWNLFVAEIDGCVRGFVSGTSYLGRAKIDNLYVDKRFHRMGIGSKLVQAYEKFAEDNDACQLTVQTRPTQQAIAFYQKNGFERAKSSYLMQKTL
jgi:ribosomal protein S18 acetylase RimI-like enzyme